MDIQNKGELFAPIIKIFSDIFSLAQLTGSTSPSSVDLIFAFKENMCGKCTRLYVETHATRTQTTAMWAFTVSLVTIIGAMLAFASAIWSDQKQLTTKTEKKKEKNSTRFPL